jgi:hypothetical protein
VNSQPYPTSYVARPASKSYVQHLYRWYAQSHPAEDFAETFAVWLTPGLNWRKRYRGWEAYEKLAYVDELMSELAGEAPLVRNRDVIEDLSELEQTLGEHYAEKRAHYQRPPSRAFDDDLSRLFVRDEQRPLAAPFLKRSRGEIRSMVGRWAGQDVFAVDEVFTRLMGRTAQLALRVGRDPDSTKRDFAMLLTARTMQVLYTGRETHPL